MDTDKPALPVVVSVSGDTTEQRSSSPEREDGSQPRVQNKRGWIHVRSQRPAVEITKILTTDVQNVNDQLASTMFLSLLEEKHRLMSAGGSGSAEA